MILKIIDGGVGDDDLLANGVIVDQGGPGVAAAAVVGEVAPIPTLGEWGQMLLAGLLGALAMASLRRRDVAGNC